MTYIPGQFGNYGQLVTLDTRYKVKIRDDLRRLLPARSYSSLVEFGCADGTNLKYFAAELNIEIANRVGVDVCKSIQEVYDGMEFHHSTVEQFLEFEERGFDVVLLSDVLEHLYNPWRILEKTKKIMTKGGVLLLSVPNIENLNYLAAVANGNFFYASTGLMDETHIRFFSMATLEKYLCNLGFVIFSKGFRPDLSLARMRSEVEGSLLGTKVVTVPIGQASVHISKENINEKFGQQALICVTNAQ